MSELPIPAKHSAVVLLSGGLDSATTAAIARHDGYQLYALSVDYGQRHRFELDAAKRVATSLGVQRHVIASVGLDQFGGSALTDEIDVPLDRDDEEMASGIPITYVPARNTVFLSLALGYAEAVGAAHLFLGVNAIDYSGYPDCRPEFIAAFERTANLATRAGTEGRGFTIEAPLIAMGKADIVREGLRLGVDFAATVSCYQADPQGRACGRCDACRLRAQGFAQAAVADPTRYR